MLKAASPTRQNKIKLHFSLALFGALLMGFSPLPAQAAFDYNPFGPSQADTQQVQTATAGDEDPQSLVGRISLIQGEASFQSQGQNNWTAATLNYPVVSGDAVATGPGSRAEIQAGPAALRLDSSSAVGIDQMDEDGVRAEVSQGQASFYVAAIAPGQTFQINTPHETIDILLPGTYRVKSGAGSTGSDEIAVLAGQAQINGTETPFTLGAGQAAQVGPSLPNGATVRPLSVTSFDRWSLTRSNAANPQPVATYVSPQMTGYQDLDNYGQWHNDPEYGNIWIPTAVQAGWAPYQYGHWVWVAPWGWTWVDNAPWGFAPFHYGRWVYFHNRWGWTPGPYMGRPVYAPALVGFGGSVGGVSFFLDIHHRPSNWFPLGPHDEYRPGFRASADYVRGVNGDGHFHGATAGNFDNRHFDVHGSARNFPAARPAAVTPQHAPDERAPSHGAGWHGDSHANDSRGANSHAAPHAVTHTAPDAHATHGNSTPNNTGWHQDRHAGPQTPAAPASREEHHSEQHGTPHETARTPAIAAPIAPRVAAPAVVRQPHAAEAPHMQQMRQERPRMQQQHQETARPQTHAEPARTEQAAPTDHGGSDHGGDNNNGGGGGGHDHGGR